MATTKRKKQGRATTTRTTSTARGRAAKTAKTAKPAKTKTKPRSAMRATAKTKPKLERKPVVASADVIRLTAKFKRERSALEKNLTEAVHEIGLLRHHELRVTQLERELKEREATIVRLQAQLAELERRPAEPVYVSEVQQTLALGSRRSDLPAEEPELDEYEDERLAEGDLFSEED